MIEDLPELYEEVKLLWRDCAAIRNNNGHIEFALKTIYDELEWFSCHQSPFKIEIYLNAYRQML